MRRFVVIVVTAMGFIEALLYNALAPLLPTFTAELHLSNAQAGTLVGIYGIGLCVAAVPAGMLAARLGVKPSLLFGLLLLGAMSIALGLVNSYGGLVMVRAVQGVAAALVWSSAVAWLVDGALGRGRGELIGFFLAGSAGGAIVGPAVGAIAVVAGRMAAFSAVAALALGLGTAAAALPRPTRAEGRRLLVFILGSKRELRVWLGLALVALSGLLMAALGVLAPLQLSRIGSGATGIGATFLLAAALGVVVRPLVGRWVDRRGALRVTRVLLIVFAPIIFVLPWLRHQGALALLVVCAVTVAGALWGPSMTLLSHEFERLEVQQAVGVGFMNFAAGIALLVGAITAGTLTDAAGEVAAYWTFGAICLTTIAGLTLLGRRSSTAGSAPVTTVGGRGV